jgi:hypothetical protein
MRSQSFRLSRQNNDSREPGIVQKLSGTICKHAAFNFRPRPPDAGPAPFDTSTEAAGLLFV